MNSEHDPIDLTVGVPEKGPPNKRIPRPFLGIHFTCCGVSARIYPNLAATAYVGSCPRCGGRLTVTIGPGGSDQRFLTAQ